MNNKKSRRYLSILLVLAFAVMMFPMSAFAANVEDFTDISSSHWAYKYVQAVVEHGLFEGTSDTTFSPETTMTRAMFVTVLARLAGVEVDDSVSTGFSDVPSGQWYTGSVAWAAENGIVEGTSDTTFTPNAPVTREQMAALIVRFAKWAGIEFPEDRGEGVVFNDASSISDFAKDDVEACRKAGILNGVSDGVFSPKTGATRAQVSAVLYRLMAIMGLVEPDGTYYTVTFNSNGGSSVASQSVLEGAKATKPANPTRSGYSFDGWYTDEALTAAYDFATAVTKSFTLYAKWAVSSGGGTGPTTVAVTGVELDKYIAEMLVGGELQLTATVLPTNASNKNVTWTSSHPGIATVDDNGLVTGVLAGEGTTIITVTTEDGGFTATCEVAVYNDPTPTTSPAATALIFPATLNYFVDEELDLTGLVIQVTNAYGQKEFISIDDLEEGVDYEISGFDSESALSGQLLTFTFLSAKYAGASFAFYANVYDVPGAGVLDAIAPPPSAITLPSGVSTDDIIAQLPGTVVITYDTDKTTLATVTWTTGDVLDAYDPATATQQGPYTFNGTVTIPTGITQPASEISIAVTCDVTILAKEWEVTIDYGWVGRATAYQYVANGGTASDPGNPTRANYTFDGWYTLNESNEEEAFVFGTTEITADTTVYAKWTLAVYTVSFDTNGGTPGTIVAQTVDYGGTLSDIGTVTKTDHALEGWYTDAGFTTKFDIATGRVYGSMTLYAKWTPLKVYLTGSLGTAADSSITGLAAGGYYKVEVGATTPVIKYVKSDGTLADTLDGIGPLTGTAITDLTNGETYKVIAATAYNSAISGRYYSSSDDYATANTISDLAVTGGLLNIAESPDAGYDVLYEFDLTNFFTSEILGNVSDSTFQYAILGLTSAKNNGYENVAAGPFYAWSLTTNTGDTATHVWTRYGSTDTVIGNQFTGIFVTAPSDNEHFIYVGDGANLTYVFEDANGNLVCLKVKTPGGEPETIEVDGASAGDYVYVQGLSSGTGYFGYYEKVQEGGVINKPEYGGDYLIEVEYTKNQVLVADEQGTFTVPSATAAANSYVHLLFFDIADGYSGSDYAKIDAAGKLTLDYAEEGDECVIWGTLTAYTVDSSKILDLSDISYLAAGDYVDLYNFTDGNYEDYFIVESGVKISGLTEDDVYFVLDVIDSDYVRTVTGGELSLSGISGLTVNDYVYLYNFTEGDYVEFVKVEDGVKISGLENDDVYFIFFWIDSTEYVEAVGDAISVTAGVGDYVGLINLSENDWLPYIKVTTANTVTGLENGKDYYVNYIINGSLVINIEGPEYDWGF